MQGWTTKANNDLKVAEHEMDDEEELVNIFDTKRYKEISSSPTLGEALKIYRENFGLSQTELGKKLGKFTR